MIPVLPSTPRRRRSARLTHWCGRAQRGLKIVCRPPGTSCEACGRQQNRLLDEAWGGGARRTDCGVEEQDRETSHQNALFGAKPLKRFSAPFCWRMEASLLSGTPVLTTRLESDPPTRTKLVARPRLTRPLLPSPPPAGAQQ